MSYASGQTISATDYNGFVSTFNGVWGTGSGDSGYGQSTTLSTVSAGATVSATEWSTLVSRLNSALTHQSGSGSGISAPVTGDTVTAISTLSQKVTDSSTYRKNFNSTRGTPTTTNYDATWSSATPTTFQQVRTVTFASANQARYFFNAGGQIGIALSVPAGGSDNNKELDWSSLTGTNVGTFNFRISDNGRTGTGGTLTANTAIGFYNLTSSNQQALQIASTTAAYTLNTITINVKCDVASNATGGATVLTFTIDYNDGSADNNAVGAGTLDQINMTVRAGVVVTPPETTNLSNTWGAVTPATTVN
jgi:hypothetical protein